MSHAYPISDKNEKQKDADANNNKNIGTEKGTMKHIETMNQYHDIMSRSQDKKMIFKFSAKWCGPCRNIQPYYETLAQDNPAINFYHIDVDALEDVAALYNVQSLPTFIYIENGKAKSQILGPSQKRLHDFLVKSQQIKEQKK